MLPNCIVLICRFADTHEYEYNFVNKYVDFSISQCFWQKWKMCVHSEWRHLWRRWCVHFLHRDSPISRMCPGHGWKITKSETYFHQYHFFHSPPPPPPLSSFDEITFISTGSPRVKFHQSSKMIKVEKAIQLDNSFKARLSENSQIKLSNTLFFQTRTCRVKLWQHK